MEKKLVILGAGGFGSVLKDVAEQLGYEIIAMLDDKIPGGELDTFAAYIADNVSFIPAFGNDEFRLSWCNRILAAGGRLATLIHPTAYVSPTAIIRPGTVVLPKAVVNTDVVIGRGCLINIGAMIDHGCVIEEGCHICVGAMINAENRIERLTRIKAGEVIAARTWSVNQSN